MYLGVSSYTSSVSIQGTIVLIQNAARRNGASLRAIENLISTTGKINKVTLKQNAAQLVRANCLSRYTCCRFFSKNNNYKFFKNVFLQLSTQKLMFYHLCKNQTHTLFSCVNIKE